MTSGGSPQPQGSSPQDLPQDLPPPDPPTTAAPLGWLEDPAVDAGFAAAYAPAPETDPPVEAGSPVQASAPVQASSARAVVDEPATPADLAARAVTADGRRARAAEPGRLSPARAVAGAAVSVAGVCLGIGTLLWVSQDPSQGPGPALTQPASQDLEALPPSVAPPTAAGAPTPTTTTSSPTTPTQAPPASAVPSVAGTAVAPPAVPSAAPAPARSVVVPVTVLNNSNRTGLADRAARRFQQGGWPIRLTGNFRGQIPVTTVYYDPGLEASARAFAADFDGIVRVRPRFASLPARGVVVVVTREFAA